MPLIALGRDALKAFDGIGSEVDRGRVEREWHRNPSGRRPKNIDFVGNQAATQLYRLRPAINFRYNITY
jgi:hypothetical protein